MVALGQGTLELGCAQGYARSPTMRGISRSQV